jgi:hypothetical protein
VKIKRAAKLLDLCERSINIAGRLHPKLPHPEHLPPRSGSSFVRGSVRSRRGVRKSFHCLPYP